MKGKSTPPESFTSLSAESIIVGPSAQDLEEMELTKSSPARRYKLYKSGKHSVASTSHMSSDASSVLNTTLNTFKFAFGDETACGSSRERSVHDDDDDDDECDLHATPPGFFFASSR
jgi:hypothetical protein